MPVNPCCCCSDPLPSGGTSHTYTVYQDKDENVAQGGSFPNSAAMMATFLAAAGGSPGVLTFECLPVTDVGSGVAVTIAPGVTVTGTNMAASFQVTIVASTNVGWNTTPGGSKFLKFFQTLGGSSSSFQLDFATPITAFGVYLTGTEAIALESLTITFDDGTPRTITVTKTNVAGVVFVGFICAGTSSITFSQTFNGVSRDIWGFDDMIYG